MTAPRPRVARRISTLRLWLLAALGLVLAASGLAGGGARAATRQQQAITPAALGQAVAGIASAVAAQWAAHELRGGALVDPVIGPLRGDYGDSMTGQAMVVAGLASQDQGLIAAGVAAELADVEHPDGGGFELLGLSEAYSQDQRALANNPAWRSARARIARFLRDHQDSISDQPVCYTAPGCYTNLKLVSAVADLSLLQTGLRSHSKGALLHDRSALRAHALALLAMAADNAGRDAYRTGEIGLSGAGILSDPSENPLAYHALSTLLLGKAVLLLGDHAPAALRAALGRTAEALVALLAPDGNGTYIGRGQGQVWTVGVTIDALAIAAELTSDPLWRGRYLSAAQVSLERLEGVYPSAGWGLPLVPRFAGSGDPSSYGGIDHYANTVEYDGLALWALDGAAGVLASVQSAPLEPLPSTVNGVFVDPSHTRFAAVTSGQLWFAVHALDSNTGDARYGFGLVAAELDGSSGWQAVLPPPPLTSQPAIGSIALRSTSRVLLHPIGRHIGVTTAGRVTIRGGWSTAAGSELVDPGTIWTYRPNSAGDGVTLTCAAPAGSTYELEVWYQAGAQMTVAQHELSVTEPDGTSQTYSVDATIELAHGKRASSAYAASLRSLVMIVRPQSGALRYTTTFALPDSSDGATGATEATGVSGSSQ